MAFEANCPACGAQIVFKSGSSVVVVCEYCHSVVARTDRALEDLGRVAEVVESASPLDLGLRGVYRGAAFELVGRAQLAHPMGGMWDEWYAAFADGRWGWLAEAQGRFYLTFQQPNQTGVPPFDALEVGRAVPGLVAPVALMVAEKGAARMLGAAGEIPYRLVPGETYPYADLSGQGGVFATIDYGERPPLLFVGHETTLDALGIVETRARERAPQRVAAAQLSCPNCAGPLELRAPDKTERVTCPNCGSLLDVGQGKLRFLNALQPPPVPPKIPIGSTGEFGGTTYTVIGFMVRSVTFDQKYYWEEYLLYNPQAGFRWLVQSDDHWNFVESVPPGDVAEGTKKSVVFRGKNFRIYQDAAARVEHVVGEFYWKVTVGETVRAVDYIRPPEMLSCEISTVAVGRESQASAAQEVNWSLGTYVSRKEVERKFGVKDLPAPHTVAPNQPFRHKRIYAYWLLLLVATFVIGVFFIATGERAVVFSQTYPIGRARQLGTSQPLIPPPPASRPSNAAARLPTVTPTPTPSSSGFQSGVAPGESMQVVFSEPFRIEARRNIKITADASLQNNWLYVEGDLINEETGLVQQFSMPLEFYFGVEDGESWSEGNRTGSTHISALPAGMYTLRLEAEWEPNQPPPTSQVSVRIEQGVPRIIYFVLALIAVSLVPLLVLIYHWKFEINRWKDSDFSPYQSSGE